MENKLPEINSLRDIQHYFETEIACKHYLANLRFADGQYCVRCGSNSALKHYNWHSKGRYYCVDCDHEFEVTEGTIFEGTNIPLNTWFQVIFTYLQHRQGSHARISYALGIDLKDGMLMLDKLNNVLPKYIDKPNFNDAMEQLPNNKPERQGFFRFTTEQKFGLWPFLISFMIYFTQSLFIVDPTWLEITNRLFQVSLAITVGIWIVLFIRYIRKVIRSRKKK